LIIFGKSVEKIEVLLKSDKNIGQFTGRRRYIYWIISLNYEGWNFNSGNYLFTTDTK